MCEKEISSIHYSNNDYKVYKQIIKKSVYDDNIKKARNIGTKIGMMVMCKVILGMLKMNISDIEKLSKIYEFCNKTIEKKGGNLD